MYALRLPAMPMKPPSARRRGIVLALNRRQRRIAFVDRGRAFVAAAAARCAAAHAFSVPRAYARLLGDAICHSAPDRFALLYDVLWRIAHGERGARRTAADPAVAQLNEYASNVGATSTRCTRSCAFARARPKTARIIRRLVRAAALHPEARNPVLRRSLRQYGLADRDAEGTAAWSEGGSSLARPRQGAGGERRRARRTLAHLLPHDVQSRARAAEGDGQSNAAALLAQHAGDRAHSATACRAEQRVAEMHDHARRSAAAVRRTDRRAQPAQQRKGRTPHRTIARGSCRLPALPAARPGDADRVRRRPARCRGSCSSASSRAIRRIWPAGPSSVPPASCSTARWKKPASTAPRLYLTNAVKHFKYEPRGKRRLHKKPNRGEIDLPLVARPRAGVDQAAARRRARRHGGARCRRPVSVTRSADRWRSARCAALSRCIRPSCCGCRTKPAKRRNTVGSSLIYVGFER